MIWCLSKTNIKYTKQEDFDCLKNFLEIFKISSEFNIDIVFYDFSRILILLILFSKERISLKFELIFDLFDEDKDGILSQKEVKELYMYVLNTVFRYSSEMLLLNKNLDKESQIYRVFMKNAEDSIDRITDDFLAYVTKGKETVLRRKFIKHVTKFSLDEKLLDFSTPKTIRKAILPSVIREITNNLSK